MMPTIGPTPPPHLNSKRKRSESDSSDNGPAPLPAQRTRTKPSPGAKPSSQVREPMLPPIGCDVAPSRGSVDQTRRVLGASLPPIYQDKLTTDPERPEAPQRSAIEDQSSDDDDLGPSLPPAGGAAPITSSWAEVRQLEGSAPGATRAAQRDDWMLAPPTGADWIHRVDPTKIKSRKFNTMKGVKTASNSEKSGLGLWTETPEEKRKRLENEVMGVKSNEGHAPEVAKAQRRNRDGDGEIERKVQEYNEAHRGSASLLEQHRDRSQRDGKQLEDDPSKRAFDREKDIAGGAFSSRQRKDVLRRAKDIGSRFQKARYQ